MTSCGDGASGPRLSRLDDRLIIRPPLRKRRDAALPHARAKNVAENAGSGKTHRIDDGDNALRHRLDCRAC